MTSRRIGYVVGMTSRDSADQRPVRVLLVEDHALVAEVTAEFLRGAGLDIRIADSGNAALVTAMAFRPDIVLCDFRLPDMSGLDVAERMRADPALKNALFALQTAMDPRDIRRLDRRADGVDMYFLKPLTESILAELLARVAAPSGPPR
jgi:CheY-like chemotaxis protein